MKTARRLAAACTSETTSRPFCKLGPLRLTSPSAIPIAGSRNLSCLRAATASSIQATPSTGGRPASSRSRPRGVCSSSCRNCTHLQGGQAPESWPVMTCMAVLPCWDGQCSTFWHKEPHSSARVLPSQHPGNVQAVGPCCVGASLQASLPPRPFRALLLDYARHIVKGALQTLLGQFLCHAAKTPQPLEPAPRWQGVQQGHEPVWEGLPIRLSQGSARRWPQHAVQPEVLLKADHRHWHWLACRLGFEQTCLMILSPFHSLDGLLQDVAAAFGTRRLDAGP